tara:strand:+ start:309 stop:620 length:312 start_codon:yes stop_codon:yes gene_type:complete
MGDSPQEQALDSLKNLIKDKAEDTTVIKKAKSVVKKHPVLATTVNSIVKQELGGSIKIGKNKKIEFLVNPEKKKTSLGFSMSFNKGGKIKTYAKGGGVRKPNY